MLLFKCCAGGQFCAPKPAFGKTLSVTGKVSEDFGVYVVEVNRMEKIPMINKRAETHFVEDMSFTATV